MSFKTGLDKEDVVHIYNGILLSHKKHEIMSFVSTWMDLEIIHPRWSNSDRERQVSYEITNMWDLIKGHKWTYLQNKNWWLKDFENKLMVTKGDRCWQGGMDWRSVTSMCTLWYTEWLANRDLCIAKGTVFNILWWSIWEKNLRKSICVYVCKWIHFVVQRKLSQHCKSTILE